MVQASCSTTSPRCCCAPGCSRTPSTCSSSATVGCASTPSPVIISRTRRTPPLVPRLVRPPLCRLATTLSLSLSGGPCLKRHVAVLALRFRKISGADLPWSFCSPALLSPRAPAPRHLPCGRVRPPSAARTTPFLALLARSLTPVASRACFPREDHIIIAPLILPRYCGWICVAASAAAISIRQVQS